MAINGVGLYTNSICTEAIPEVGGVFTLSTLDVYDFGRVFQIWCKNENLDRELKSMYVFITGDSTDALYGQRYCSLSNYDGTNKTTTGKLYLKNNNIESLSTEMIQIHFEPLYGITTQNALLLQLVLSNHQVNVATYSVI